MTDNIAVDNDKYACTRWLTLVCEYKLCTCNGDYLLFNLKQAQKVCGIQE